jgi:hypothetical protein
VQVLVPRAGRDGDRAQGALANWWPLETARRVDLTTSVRGSTLMVIVLLGGGVDL